MKRWLRAILPWMAWIASSALTVLTWAILRTTTVAIAVAAKEIASASAEPEKVRLWRWSVAAIDNFAIFGFGVIALGLVLAFEHIYRKAHSKGRLGQQFGAVTGVQAAILAVCSIVLAVLRVINAA